MNVSAIARKFGTSRQRRRFTVCSGLAYDFQQLLFRPQLAIFQLLRFVFVLFQHALVHVDDVEQWQVNQCDIRGREERFKLAELMG
jgi:hypothetical protein